LRNSLPLWRAARIPAPQPGGSGKPPVL